MATINSGNFQVAVSGTTMTFPTQNASAVFNNATVSNITGDGTLYTPVQLNAEIVDRGANFASNTFTAAVSGLYLVTVNILTQGNDASMTDGICYLKTSVKTLSHYINATNWRAATYLSYSYYSIVPLAAAETVKAELSVSGSGATVDVFGNGASPLTNISCVLLF